MLSRTTCHCPVTGIEAGEAAALLLTLKAETGKVHTEVEMHTKGKKRLMARPVKKRAGGSIREENTKNGSILWTN